MSGILKNALLAGAYYSGLAFLILWISLRRRAVVLTYHRVLPPERSTHSYSSQAIIVTPETFERHMRFVRRFLNPVSVSDFEALLLAKSSLPPRTCLITFDDGWHDNLEFALPVLERYRVPAVLFVATDYIGTNRGFWQEHLARLLHLAWKQRCESFRLPTRINWQKVAAAKDSVEARQAVREVINDLKSASLIEIEKVMIEVEAIVQDDDTTGHPASPEDRFLSWADVRALCASGVVTIGSHTTSHIPLTKRDQSIAAAELSASRRAIETHTASSCRSFAYPNGDHDDRAIECVRAAGYALAFTTMRGYVSTGVDPLRLKRINMHEHASRSPAAFLARLAGLV